MAAKNRLKITSLKFLSLVDTPAQETATIRLVKRKGGIGVNGTMRIVKTGEGDDPLVYCWAFTCTDETGAPYHDLQGDAIEPATYIKAAEEFMRASAAVDEMHDRRQTSRIAFAFPMDSDIATAMLGAEVGQLVKTSGLMTALRVAPDALAKIRAGEYKGVSIDGEGIRTPVGKRRIGKSVVLTSVVDGHQHQIDLDAPADGSWDDMLTTSYATAEGAATGHSHAWIYDRSTGAITIATDSGHTHAVDAVVPAEVIQRAIAEESKQGDDGQGSPVACGDEDESGERPAVVVEVHARAPISPPTPRAGNVVSMDDKIAKALIALDGDQRTYAQQLAPDELIKFASASAAERATIVKAALDADPVVYTTASGVAIRKSHGDIAVMLAKQADESAKQATAASEVAAVNKAAVELASLEKRAGAELSHFAKSRGAHVALLRAVDGIADEKVRAEVVEALKGANAAMVELGKHKGYTPDSGPPGDISPKDELANLVKRYQTENKVTEPKAWEAVLNTTDGQRLYAVAHRA